MARPDTSAAFFERLYRRESDPWQFDRSPYELARYAAIVEALGDRTYDAIFEPGCSIGALTERLAPRCRSLYACDASESAAARARARVQAYAHVQVECASLPADIPARMFDLVVFCEIGYYFERPALRALLATLAERLLPSGLLLGCHWLGHSPDHVLHGSTVHNVIDACDFTRVASRVDPASASGPGYRLDLWRVGAHRTDPAADQPTDSPHD